jgi:hypothetical protein
LKKNQSLPDRNNSIEALKIEELMKYFRKDSGHELIKDILLELSLLKELVLYKDIFTGSLLKFINKK